MWHGQLRLISPGNVCVGSFLVLLQRDSGTKSAVALNVVNCVFLSNNARQLLDIDCGIEIPEISL